MDAPDIPLTVRSPQWPELRPIDLKKLLSSPSLAVILQQLVEQLGTPIHLLDTQSRVVFRSRPGDQVLSLSTQQIPIHDHHDILGWVVGVPSHAIPLASLLSYLIGQEYRQHQLSQRLIERSHALQLIYGLSEKMGRSLDLITISTLVLHEIQQTLSASNGSIMILNQETGYLEIVAAFGEEYHPKTPMRLGEGIAGHVLISGQPEIINDVFSDMRLMIGHNLLHALMCVPLKMKDRIIGVINVSHNQVIAYQESDLAALIALASQAAPSINNAILHKKILLENKLNSEKHYRTVVEQSLEAIIVVDIKNRRIVEVNTAFTKLLGYEASAISSLELSHILDLPSDDISQLLANLDPQHSNDLGNQRYRHQDGSLIDVDVSINMIRQGSRQAYCLIAHDLRQQKKAEADLHRSAYYDSLTTLPNRTFLIEHLRKVLTKPSAETNTWVAVLFLDLDGFKIVNDSLGHKAGDEFLIAIANRLAQCLLPEDTVARFGGDEFVILLDAIEDLPSAILIANRLLDAVQSPLHLNDRPVFPTASIGIALSQRGEEEAENLLQAADIAMHRAKAQGKARYAVFDKKMFQQAMERMQLETDLRLALDRQEFRVYYQPIVLLENRHIVGFEALIRWQHPIHGLIPPGQFLPVAEECGLIVAIDQWAMEQACQQLCQWQHSLETQSLPVISINLSGKNFSQPDLVPHIRYVLEKSNLDPTLIKLEITESILTENNELVVDLLRQLRQLGLRLSIDDFGTGYSSLSRLHLFPIDTLKIDRSFLSRMGSHGENPQTVQTIITLAHSLQMDVVAEGVETIEQLQQLRRLHCEYGQGYFFFPALTGDAAASLLLNQGRTKTPAS